MAASTHTRTRLKKELFKKKEEAEENLPAGKAGPAKKEEPEESAPEKVEQKKDTVSVSAEAVEIKEEVSKPAEEDSTPSSEDDKPPIIEDSGAAEIKEESKEESKPQDSPPSGNSSLKRRLMWVGLLFVYVAILAAGGYFMYQLGLKKGEEAAKLEIEKQIEKEKAAVPTATPTPSIDKSKYKIKVLNGTGISGEAARAKELLEGDGFTVSSVGNASSQGNVDTTIETKEEVESDFVSALKETIGKTYKVGDVKTITTSETTDIVIILGGKEE